MMTKKITNVFAGVLLVVALAAGGYWLLQQAAPDNCRICQREIHPEARAVMEVAGRREPICCARCALTLAQQRGKPAGLVEVTDYVSRRALKPEEAYFVEGSQVILCERHEPLLDQTKQPYDRIFDRCVPSVYAFARREDAEVFVARNGGAVLRLAQLLEEVEPRP